MNVSKKKEGRGVSGGGDGCGTPHTALTRVLRKLRAHIPLKTWAALSATGEVEAAILTYLAHTPPGNRATVAEYIETHYPAVLAQVYAQYVFGPKWWVSATLLALAPILLLPELAAYTAILRFIFTGIHRGGQTRRK
jgi:hypothetical protein